MSKARIKKGDMVVVISGKDRDLSTPRRVLEVMNGNSRVLVEGVGMVKRHTKPNPQRNVKGGILERESPIHLSNVSKSPSESDRGTVEREAGLSGGQGGPEQRWRYMALRSAASIGRARGSN